MRVGLIKARLKPTHLDLVIQMPRVDRMPESDYQSECVVGVGHGTVFRHYERIVLVHFQVDPLERSGRNGMG